MGLAPSRRLAWLALGLLFACASLYQGHYSWVRLDTATHAAQRPRAPFTLRADSTIASVTPEAAAAGLRVGDRIERFCRNAVRGRDDVICDLQHEHHPGEAVPVVATRHGDPLGLRSIVISAREVENSVDELAVALTVEHLTPWFCLALGFFVAFLRPLDGRAWVLAMLTLSFAQITTETPDPVASLDPALRFAATFYHIFFGASWAAWMALFGVAIARDAARIRLFEHLRWLLALPVLAFALLNATAAAGVSVDMVRFGALARAAQRMDIVMFLVAMASISLFFAVIGAGIARAQTPDIHRRLKLLSAGSSVALTPAFLLTIASRVMHVPMGDFPAWLFIPATLCLLIFPVTLAYVIVVERAMDLRVVIRTGLQYALARFGVRVLRALVLVGLISMMVSGTRNARLGVEAKVFITLVAIAGIFGMRRGAEALRSFVDRRFFREAVDAERLLTSLGETLPGMVERDAILREATTRIAGAMHVERLFVLLEEQGTLRSVAQDAAPALCIAADSALVRAVCASRTGVLIFAERKDNWIYDATIDNAARETLLRYGAQLVLPLALRDELLGLLVLGAKRSEEPYTNADLRLLSSVSSQVALALHNARLTESIAHAAAQRERLDRELEIAEEVQRRLFPQQRPDVASTRYAALCVPAQSVGGDYYDYLLAGDGRLVVAVGDVCGKGVGAALLMANLQASLRSLVASGQSEPATMLTLLNRLIYDATASNRFITLWLGLWDPQSRRLDYASAGHGDAFVVAPGAETTRLAARGVALGLTRRTSYRSHSVELAPGALLAVATDGITEAMNAHEDEFGEQRLMDALRDGAACVTPELAMERVLNAVRAFADGAPQHDDITLLVLQSV